MKFTLITDWDNAGTVLKAEDYKGKFLNIGDEEFVKGLIEDGIAAEYTEQTSDKTQKVDVEVGEPASTTSNNVLTTESLEKLLDEHLKKNSEPEVRKTLNVEVGKTLTIGDDPQGGYKTYQQFCRDIACKWLKNEMTPALAKWQNQKTMETVVDSAGGTLVPPAFGGRILDKAQEVGSVWTRAFGPVPLAGNSIKHPVVDETSRAAGSRGGGIRGYWEDESEAHTESETKYDFIDLRLNKLNIQTPVSDELLEDSAFPVESILTNLFGKELAFMLDEAAIRGTGAGQPLGITNAPGTIDIPAEGSQAATTIVAENIINMFARLHARSAGNAVWFINQDTLPQLYTMSIAVGTGGSLVYTPPAGLSEAPYGTLFGRPVVPVESCSTLGTSGDIILADMDAFLAAEKSSGINVRSSVHLYFATDRMAFKASVRVDGQPWWRSAISPNQGTNTQSPFLTLATRS